MRSREGRAELGRGHGYAPPPAFGRFPTPQAGSIPTEGKREAGSTGQRASGQPGVASWSSVGGSDATPGVTHPIRSRSGQRDRSVRIVLHGKFDGREFGGHSGKNCLAASTFDGRAVARQDLGNDDLLTSGDSLRGKLLGALTEVNVLGGDQHERHREPECRAQKKHEAGTPRMGGIGLRLVHPNAMPPGLKGLLAD